MGQVNRHFCNNGDKGSDFLSSVLIGGVEHGVLVSRANISHLDDSAESSDGSQQGQGGLLFVDAGDVSNDGSSSDVDYISATDYGDAQSLKNKSPKRRKSFKKRAPVTKRAALMFDKILNHSENEANKDSKFLVLQMLKQTE